MRVYISYVVILVGIQVCKSNKKYIIRMLFFAADEPVGV